MPRDRSASEGSRSLSEAVRGVMEARGLRPAQLAVRVGGTRSRATVYQVLSGATANLR